MNKTVLGSLLALAVTQVAFGVGDGVIKTEAEVCVGLGCAPDSKVMVENRHYRCQAGKVLSDGVERIEWARRCYLKEKNTPDSWIHSIYYSTNNNAYHPENGEPPEPPLTPEEQYAVTSDLYNSDAYGCSAVSAGYKIGDPIPEACKTGPRKRANMQSTVYYPTFLKIIQDPTNNKYYYTNEGWLEQAYGNDPDHYDRNAPCRNVRDIQDYKTIFFCSSGCYAASMRLDFGDAHGKRRIDHAADSHYEYVKTLAPGTDLESLATKITPVEYFVRSFDGTSTETLLALHMANGKKLKVTKNHVLVNGDGKLVTSVELAVGDTLLAQNGEKVKITGVFPFEHKGVVYNVQPKGRNAAENLVFAEGFLNGAHFYQLAYSQIANRLLSRASLADGVLDL